MKVVHTYATGNTGGPISKVNFYNMVLSAWYAKFNYGDVTLYGDNAVIKPLTDTGFDKLYSEIIKKEYHQSHLGAWSIPKLDTFKSVNEPFLHIDTDTTLFKTIDFKGLKAAGKHTDNLFCYKDQDKMTAGEHSEGDVLSKFLRGDLYYDAQNRTYLDYYFKYWNSFSDDFKRAFDMNSIPNMNLVHAQNYELINEASELAMKFFIENKSSLETDRDSACFLEQFLVHTYMRLLDKDYSEASSQGSHVIFDQEPFQKWDMNENSPFALENYPCSFNYEQLCSECSYTHYKEVIIKSEADVDLLYDCDMGGYFHTTSNKEAPLIESYMLHKLERVIGLEGIIKIWQYYVPQLEKMKENVVSGGEHLFQLHKGISIFK